ncbi:hypothetical protein SprV_0802467200 [Sparganum proliferum]
MLRLKTNRSHVFCLVYLRGTYYPNLGVLDLNPEQLPRVLASLLAQRVVVGLIFEIQMDATGMLFLTFIFSESPIKYSKQLECIRHEREETVKRINLLKAELWDVTKQLEDAGVCPDR